MTRPAIVYDLTRLLLGPTLPVPRGIDRVDLGYVRYFLESWPGDFFGVLPLPLGFLGGAAVLQRDAVHKFLACITAAWGETGSAAADPAFAFVRARLSDPNSDFPHPCPPYHFRPHRVVTNLVAALSRAGIAGLGLRNAIPNSAIYLNTGQLGLGFHWPTAWLARRPDIRRVFMLHDVIPLEHSALVTNAGRDLHARMVANTALYADGLIVTTQTVRESVSRELGRCGRADIATFAAPLPVAPLFLEEAASEPPLPDTPYFVIVGSIEPRKNHALLLEVWRRWPDVNPPHLVIVGTPWRDSERVLEQAARHPRLRRSVVHAAGLTSPALRALLRHARALLQPSLAEGFGLPVIEALALGTPVIASDQPAHREAGGDAVVYLDPRDANGWARAVRAHLYGPRQRIPHYRSWNWVQYGAAVMSFLESVPQRDKLV